MTATEVIARREQQRRLMAPIVGRIQSEFLEPVILNTFNMLGRMKQLPEQPDIVVGKELDIEYTGELARAQKAEVSVGIESWLNVIAVIAEVFPEAKDIPDIDETTRLLGLQRGVPAKAMRSREDIEEVREARAEAEKQAAEAAALQMGGEALKAAGEGAQAVGMMPEGQTGNA